MFMRKEFIKKFYYLFWIFIVGCFVGWIVEGVFSFLKHGIFMNHSALVIGPFNAAYGLSACFLSALLVKYQNDNYFKIFLSQTVPMLLWNHIHTKSLKHKYRTISYVNSYEQQKNPLFPTSFFRGADRI